MSRVRRVCAAVFILAALTPADAGAYSVLAHAASIDQAWDTAIRPLLEKRFGHQSIEAMDRARSFAYGGSVIQDLGYYPFGNRLFSNLLHYVRSGDFIEALVRESRDIDELAFSLGALAHYADDNTGHPEATNRAVPIVFPKLTRKFGNTVTYVQAPKQHVIVEFSFDVVQAAGGQYLPQAYKRFIGFRVAQGVLERAFRDTYGLEMNDLFRNPDRAIATYRYAVSQLMPALTAAAWKDKHDEIQKILPAIQQSGFVFTYSRADYEQDYGADYQKPSRFARFLGFLYRILPKIGPLKPLAFEAPTPDVELMFARSFRHATDRYGIEIASVATDRFDLANTDLDTGRASRHGEYALADDTYADLLSELRDRPSAAVPQALRRNIAAFYGPQPAPVSKHDRKHWHDTEETLAWLAADGKRLNQAQTQIQ